MSWLDQYAEGPQGPPGPTGPTGPTGPGAWTPVVLSTTDATPTTILTIPIAAGGTSVLRGALVIANLGAGDSNANLAPSFWADLQVVGYRTPAGLGANSPTATSSPTKPFCNFGNASQGSLGFGVSGNSLILQVTGFAVIEAWTSGHAYLSGDGATTPGQFVTANGNVYLCTTSGTASGTAPSGTGTGIGTGAVFAYIAPANGSQVPVTWTLAAPLQLTG